MERLESLLQNVDEVVDNQIELRGYMLLCIDKNKEISFYYNAESELDMNDALALIKDQYNRLDESPDNQNRFDEPDDSN